MSDVAEITNFVQLTDEYGTGGQPSAQELEAIAGAGYQAVINLALATSDRAIDDEGSIVTGLGMSYFHIPVDFDAPTLDDARVFCGVMRALEGKRVFVHCAMNLRVSAFMYVYLKHARGLSEAEARSPILDRWDPRMSDPWRQFIQLSLDELKAGADLRSD